MAFDANDLSPHEHFVVERTNAGEIADFSAMGGPGGAKPIVRAGFLRKLLVGLDETWVVRAPGVRLRGALIDGELDLTDCSGAGGGGLPALSLEGCDLPRTIDISHARLARLSLRDSALRQIIADEAAIDGEFNLSGVAPFAGEGGDVLTAQCRGLRVDGDVRAGGAKFARPVDEPTTRALDFQTAEISGALFLNHEFDAFGEVRLTGARIGGALQCEGGSFLNRTDNAEGFAINAVSAVVGASVLLRAGFKAEGVIRFANATIGGEFNIGDGVFRNDHGIALLLSGATLGELRGKAKINGALSLYGATVLRNVDLRGAEIANPRLKTSQRGSEWATAIDAPNLRVGGAVLLQGANIKGEVFLADARINGYFLLGGGRFINGGDWAIRAPNLKVGGNLTLKIDDTGFAPLGQKTVVEGGVKFDRAEIAGEVAWLNLELRGPGPEGAKGAILSFADARIGGSINARQLVTQHDANINLSGASCVALDDDVNTGWGVNLAGLELDGFSYGRLEAGKNDGWRTRLVWVKRAVRHRFSPQPFTALAQTYARAGRREDARRILLAQHDMRTRHASSGPLTMILSSAFGLAAGYGLSPIRAARALLLYLALGVAGVLTMNAQGALVTPQGTQCNGAVDPALYAIDVALPVIDLGQERRCGPGRTARADLWQGTPLGESDWRLFEGVAVWRWAHALYAMLGAILTALAIVTFSGIMKPKDE